MKKFTRPWGTLKYDQKLKKVAIIGLNFFKMTWVDMGV